MSKTKEALEMALYALDVANSLSNGELIDFRKYGFKVDSDITKMFESVRNSIREALAEQEPVVDKHQTFIDSLPSDTDDKMFEQIHYWARQSYAMHQRSTRGQTITAADSSDSHIIWAALRWAKENAAPEAPAWQELSEDEVLGAYMDSPLDLDLHISELCAFASEISAALRAKNGATK